MLFSEPKIPQSVDCTALHAVCAEFQCSSASRKFLNPRRDRAGDVVARVVSVLFSEPKIPQSASHWVFPVPFADVSVLFSEPKIPQSKRTTGTQRRVYRFSALQRAENSSMVRVRNAPSPRSPRFSALQRAENSSIRKPHRLLHRSPRFQCSSASRKFLNKQTPHLCGAGC